LDEQAQLVRQHEQMHIDYQDTERRRKDALAQALSDRERAYQSAQHLEDYALRARQFALTVQAPELFRRIDLILEKRGTAA
jgi:hypothetical protein